VVDIKSKLLKEALMEIMKDVQGETLEAEEPSVDPNMLFLFLEDIRTHYRKTLKARLKKEKKRKAKKRIRGTISHCRVLCRYLDEDYEETKKTLYPLLKAGNITFDLLWALFKPNTIAYTSTYNDHDNPRCFKVDRATKEQSFMRGEWYSIEGRYLEYDGKNYGLGDFEAQVDQFKGSRKITSLSTYPLQYHKDPEAIKKLLVDRGKHFVSMTGMNYRFHKGMAFQKKRKGVAKFNINGRVMIDPATFRRINPNYAISLIKPKDDDDEETDSEDECGCGKSSDEGDDNNPLQMGAEEKEELPKTKFKVILDPKNKKRPIVVEVPIDENGRELARPEKLETIASDVETGRVFTEEELLIASPVVLGFAFSEKAWLEFSLSGIREIEWNERAYESLVLPKNQKHVVKALVSSHKFHAAETIDDVVQGKGRGLVFVLHGPPGVGKTLTAEGVAEDLRCPLYAVSMGELGTDSNRLEQMLQQVMDIAHSWGAVLLLDEADVFLEKRQHQDVHRNALVSIFLRLLEYFQGILFLTTNRVETFDEAFQSRIHVALKYEELTSAAQKKVWKEFIEKVRVMQGIEIMPFTESDYDYLARRRLNGRQIKNAVRTAQALALHEDAKLSMEHVKRVLEVAESFEQDLKGGTGYLDAMRSYT
jgi:DNA polymerase III delta prime subunit